jgi:hypothetical protein
MLFMLLLVSCAEWTTHWGRSVLVAGLVLLPYAVAVGTGNSLFTQVVDSLAPWGALIAMIMITRRPVDSHATTIVLLGLCFTLMLALQVVTSGLRPYQMDSPLTQQNTIFYDERLGAIKVDERTLRFLTDAKAAVKGCNIAPGAPFVGLYNILGMALVLHSVPPVTPWLNNKEQAEFVLARMPLNLRAVVLAIKMGADGALPSLPRQLADFPNGYRYCGEATYPYASQRIEIWYLGI